MTSSVDNLIRLTGAPIELDNADVGEPSAGGACVFIGTTRAESHDARGALLALQYEAYGEMAEGQLADLAARARSRWPVRRIVLLHRVGRVAVGEASVLVAVSAPHRAEAFECCRWLIDTLKAELAVWKREVWERGDATWAAPNAVWGDNR